MPKIFQEYKKLIDAYLVAFLSKKRAELSKINTYGSDVIDRIIPLITAGKTIRGSLALFAYCFTHDQPSEDSVKLAAAMELMQTALIIHDDIMDKDATRRGMQSLHVQYKNESLAMCAGDVLFFLAFELLAPLGKNIVELVAKEYQYVGVAQMADVSKSAKTKAEIINLYSYKTARYTFAVPLMAGAILTRTTKETLKYLESFGVATGMLFQIQDDKLDSEGNPFTDQDINDYTKAAEESLKRLLIPQDKKQILENLLHFVVTRNT